MISENATAAEGGQWTLSKIDIRAPVKPNAWPVARLSLVHPKRGPVTDIGTAPGAFDAAFNALARITGSRRSSGPTKCDRSPPPRRL
jgi:hypothetical protein